MNRNGLKIGKIIFGLLSENEEMQKSVNNRIYPIVADNNAKMPFIVYKRNSIITNSTKDGIYKDTIMFEVVIVSEKYSDGIDIAETVRKIINRPEVKYQDLTTNDVELISADERFEDNVFVQHLIFQSTSY